jgi:hypothetical protein
MSKIRGWIHAKRWHRSRQPGEWSPFDDDGKICRDLHRQGWHNIGSIKK